MDIIFKLLTQLAASLSPGEFLVALVIIIMMAFTIVRFILKGLQKKNGGLLRLLIPADESEPTEKLSQKLDQLIDAQKHFMTIQTHEESMVKMMLAINEIHANEKTHDDALHAQMTDLILLKKDLLQLAETMTKVLEDIKHQMKMHDVQDMQSAEAIKELLQRSQDMLHRIISQIEKVDEFARATIPEFRSYHKELSKEVSELNRDIALVERSIQTQINTANAIKLR